MSTSEPVFRDRKIVIPWKVQPDLAGNRFILGRMRFARFGTSNGVPFKTFELSEGATQSDDYTYIPDATFDSAVRTQDFNHGYSSRYRVGDRFNSVAVDNNPSRLMVYGRGIYTNVGNTQQYRGGFQPPIGDIFWAHRESYVNPGSFLQPGMSDYDRQVWSRTKPRLRYADAFIFLKEIGETPLMLKDTADLFSRDFRSIGGFVDRQEPWIIKSKELADHYLNANFGWAPFLGDLGKFHKVYQNGQKLLAKLAKENSQPVRKKTIIKAESTKELIASGNYGGYNSISYPIHCFPVSFPSHFFVAPPSWELWEEQSTHVSGVGRFSYYRAEFDMGSPDASTAWNTIQRYLTLYGLRINPITLYRAMPWTWLFDWFTGFGQYVEYLNDSVIDQIMSDYCFVMQTQITTRRFIQDLPFASGTVRLVFERHSVSKQREKVSPPSFFNPPGEGLTPWQLSILASLRLSKRTVRTSGPR